MATKKQSAKKAANTGRKALAKGKRINEVKPLAIDAYMQIKD